MSMERETIKGALAAFGHVIETGGHLDVTTAKILIGLIGQVFPLSRAPCRVDILERLSDAVRTMRANQRAYFRRHDRGILVTAKADEKRVDALLDELEPGPQQSLF